MKDYQQHVTDEVIDRKYIPYNKLKYQDYADEWVRTVIVDEDLGITADEGVIITKTGTVRRDLKSGGYAEVYRDQYGVELPAMAVRQMPPNVRAELVANKVWDFRITNIEVTDGPAQKEALMMTHEQHKQAARADEDAQNNTQQQLAEAISALAEATGKRGPGRPRKEEA